MHELEVMATLAVLGLVAAVAAVASVRWRRVLAALSLFAFLGLAGMAYLTVKGSVVLLDRSGRVASAGFAPHSRIMHRLPLGIFYGEPPGEANVLLTCSDGRVINLGYATTAMPRFERLTPPEAC
jgi:hypothetical protein